MTTKSNILKTIAVAYAAAIAMPAVADSHDKVTLLEALVKVAGKLEE